MYRVPATEVDGWGNDNSALIPTVKRVPVTAHEIARIGGDRRRGRGEEGNEISEKGNENARSKV